MSDLMLNRTVITRDNRLHTQSIELYMLHMPTDQKTVHAFEVLQEKNYLKM